jgi:hypothetical protein
LYIHDGADGTAVDKWGAICFVLSSTGLFLIAVSFSVPWYQIDDYSYGILSGRSGYDSLGHPIQTTGIVRDGLVFGVLLWWIFMVTSVLRPSVIRAAVGWLAVAIVAACLAHTLRQYPLESGWLVGALALVLLGIAATSDLNRAFLQGKMKDKGGPFADD